MAQEKITVNIGTVLRADYIAAACGRGNYDNNKHIYEMDENNRPKTDPKTGEPIIIKTLTEQEFADMKLREHMESEIVRWTGQSMDIQHKVNVRKAKAAKAAELNSEAFEIV